MSLSMSLSQKTRGSAHVIIIVCLVVALLVALGVVFYQNLIVKNNTSTTTSNSNTDTTASTASQTTTKLLTGSLSDGFGATLTFGYPADWSLARATTGPLPIVSSGDTTDEKLTVTSPSGKFSVTYWVVSTGGFGGACIPEETGTFVSTSYQQLSKFSNVSYLEYTTTSMPIADDGTHSIGKMRLVMTDAAKKSISGASVCEVSFAGIIPLNSDGVTLLEPEAKISGVKTAEDFKAAAKGTEYEQAKAILLSTSH